MDETEYAYKWPFSGKDPNYRQKHRRQFPDLPANHGTPCTGLQVLRTAQLHKIQKKLNTRLGQSPLSEWSAGAQAGQ